MTDRQRAKLAMYQATLRVLDGRAADYQANKALQKAVARFAALVAELDPEQQAARVDASGLYAVKKSTRRAVATQAADVAAALYALATDPDRPDLELQAAVDYTVLGLLRKTDADLVRLGRLIYDRGTAHAKALADHDVSAADLDGLRDALDAFKTEQAAPRAALSEGAASTKLLGRDFRAAQKLLTDQLDRQLSRYETKAPALFAAYQSARKLNNTAVRYAKPDNGGEPK